MTLGIGLLRVITWAIRLSPFDMTDPPGHLAGCGVNQKDLTLWKSALVARYGE